MYVYEKVRQLLTPEKNKKLHKKGKIILVP